MAEPRATAPNSTAPTEKWNEGPMMRPFMVSGSGAGCPSSTHSNTSEKGPSLSWSSSTSTVSFAFVRAATPICAPATSAPATI